MKTTTGAREVDLVLEWNGNHTRIEWLVSHENDDTARHVDLVYLIGMETRPGRYRSSVL